MIFFLAPAWLVPSCGVAGIIGHALPPCYRMAWFFLRRALSAPQLSCLSYVHKSVHCMDITSSYYFPYTVAPHPCRYISPFITVRVMAKVYKLPLINILFHLASFLSSPCIHRVHGRMSMYHVAPHLRLIPSAILAFLQFFPHRLVSSKAAH